MGQETASRILRRKGHGMRFTTPKAPHHNGCVEAMVKTCKKALKKVVGDQTLTPFELYTYLLESANLVNQRPIGRAPNDPDDGSYLRPNDILLGRERRKCRKVRSNQPEIPAIENLSKAS